jgi:hypothetical protein
MKYVAILVYSLLLSPESLLPSESGEYHNLLPWMIGNEAYLNAFIYVPEFRQTDCRFSHVEMSRYITPIYQYKNDCYKYIQGQLLEP